MAFRDMFEATHTERAHVNPLPTPHNAIFRVEAEMLSFQSEDV